MHIRQHAALQHALRAIPHLAGKTFRPFAPSVDSLFAERIVVGGVVLTKRLWFVMQPHEQSLWAAEIQGFMEPIDDTMLTTCVERHLMPLVDGVGEKTEVQLVDARNVDFKLPDDFKGVGRDVKTVIVVNSGWMWLIQSARPAETLEALKGAWPTEAEQAAYAAAHGVTFAQTVESIRQRALADHQLEIEYQQLYDLVERALASEEAAAYDAALAYHTAQIAKAVEDFSGSPPYQGTISVAFYRNADQPANVLIERATVAVQLEDHQRMLVWETWRNPDDEALTLVRQAMACAAAFSRRFSGVVCGVVYRIYDLQPCDCGKCPSNYSVITVQNRVRP